MVQWEWEALVALTVLCAAVHLDMALEEADTEAPVVHLVLALVDGKKDIQPFFC